MLDHASAQSHEGAALTPREREVLAMIGLGLTNAEVADRLHVTVHAVKFHLSHVYRKLGVSNRTEAAVAFHQLSVESSNGAPSETDATLSGDERQRVLVDWNATAAPFPDRGIHELVSERAAAIPDEVAVVDGRGTELTYRELDRRANKLAHHLRGLGVGPDILVGLAVSRSATMVVGLLGILKAGGAYVPIDPAYPAERIAFMLEDAGAPVLVTEEPLLGNLPQHSAQVVCLDRDWETIERGPDEPVPSTAGAENLAYVIYTSGSTGRPKGVEIPHRALVNFLTTMRERPGLGSDDVLLAVTTLSFDIAGLELYLPLLVGAKLVVAAHEETSDPARLMQQMERHGVTAMQATPTTWRMLINAGWSGRPGMKVLCGGEALPTLLAEQLLERDVELWNMYGPTETTIWSTTHRLLPGEPLTIGRPIANTSLYILDLELTPTAIGVPGELFIGGAGLARGYRGRSDLTDERFIPHPFDSTPGARIYRTGDLASYRDDGTVDFLGRLDNQVKVRGFRIELGEIETVLGRHPQVGSAVAMAREDTPGDPRVVAYVIPDGEAAASSELRRFAGESLPAYMVPSVVMTVEEFPLTPNGKIDRRSLPAPTYERETEYVAPRTQLEEQLARLWEEELGIRPIGVTDDFFTLGATSLIAARLFARIQRELKKDLPLSPVFQAPTIEKLATLLEHGTNGKGWTSLVPMQPLGSKPPVFCVHGGAGTILHLQPLAQLLGPDRPFYGLQSRGLYGGAPPLRTVEEMAKHYLSEIRTVQPEGPYYLAGYCFGTIVAFELAQMLTHNGEEVALVAMMNGPSPTWLRRYGGIGGQPRHRAARVAKAPAPVPLHRKVLRVLLSVEKQRDWLGWAVWKLKHSLDLQWARLSLTLNRPLPEWMRENYFLRMHGEAELAYELVPFQGEVLMFSGAGLYEDLSLGWDGFAERGVRTFEAPGKHRGNRDLMHPPAVDFVAERLEEYFAESADARGEGSHAAVAAAVS